MMDENKEWTDITPGSPEAEANDWDTPAEVEDKGPAMGVFQKIIGIFIDPVNTLQAIGRRPEFWVPLVVLTIVTVCLSAYNVEVLKSAKMGDMAFQAQARGVEVGPEPSSVSLILPGIFTTPIGLLIGWAIAAGIMCLIVMVLGGSFRFAGLFSMMAWVSMPSIFKSAVAMFAMHGKQYTSSYAMGMAQAKGTAGLGLFFGGSDFLSMLMGQIDVFLIWAFLLTWWGLPFFTSLKKQQALTATIIYNVVTLVVMTGMMFLGSQMYEKAMSQVS